MPQRDVIDSGIPETQGLEGEVQTRAEEIARLLSRMSEPVRSMAAHNALHAIRAVVGEQPDIPLQTVEPGRQNFAVFGLLLLMAGLLITVLYRGFGFFSVPVALIGAGILLVSLAAWALRRRGSRKPMPGTSATERRRAA